MGECNLLKLKASGLTGIPFPALKTKVLAIKNNDESNENNKSSDLI